MQRFTRLMGRIFLYYLRTGFFLDNLIILVKRNRGER